MKHLTGTAANGEHTINDGAYAKQQESFSARRSVKMYGEFGGASVKIGFVGVDGVNYFEDTSYTGLEQVTVEAGKTTKVVIEVTGAGASADFYVEETYF